jgi:hypothetical protein
MSSRDDAGMIAVLLQSLQHERLPALQRLKQRVDAGERLDDFDLEHLNRAVADIKGARLDDLLARHPEYRGLVSAFFAYVKEIVDRAKENEMRSRQGGPPDQSGDAG